MNLRKVWEIKGNTKKSREILGYFSSISYKGSKWDETWQDWSLAIVEGAQ